MSDPSADLSEPPLEAYRSYLHVLAGLHLGGWLRGKLSASDLVQDALLRAHAALPDLRDRRPAAMQAWLRRILARQLADAAKHHRRDKRDAARVRALADALERSAHALESLVAGEQPSPSQAAAHQDELLALAAALDALPDDQRTVVLWKHLENRPIRAIAEAMDRTPAAVAGLLRRGLARLRSLLDAPSTGARAADSFEDRGDDASARR